MQKKRSAFMSSFFPLFLLVALLSCMTSRPVQARVKYKNSTAMDTGKQRSKGKPKKKGQSKTQKKKKGKKSQSKR